MTDQLAIEEEGEITLVLRTMGVEDQSVELLPTMTMRPTGVRRESGPATMLPQLPRLMKGGETSTMPELRIKGVLGEGGMGLVELAEQMAMGRDVAVKKVRDQSRSPEAMLTLLREGWTTGLLEHPNIVPVYTLGRDEDDGPVIVMKRIEGTSWLEVIKNPSLAPEAFEAEDPYDIHVEILTQVCNAMHYAHSRSIIHRDLKPENVMLGEFGEVYVLDWGIARDAQKAAALLIADLPRRNPELEARLEALKTKLAGREQEFEVLQRISYDVDSEVGRGSRTGFVIIMGVIWGVMSTSLAISIEFGYLVLSHPRAFLHIVLLTLILATVIYIGRRRFFENELNRRLIYCVLAGFVGTIIMRAISWASEIPIRTSVTFEILTYALVCCLSALALDRRLFVAGIPFLAAAITGAIFPALVFWSFSAANILAMALLAYVWWPTAESGQAVYNRDGCPISSPLKSNSTEVET